MHAITLTAVALLSALTAAQIPGLPSCATSCVGNSFGSCGSLDASDLGPDGEAVGPCGSVLGGGDVIATEMEEIVDLITGGEKPLRLAG